VVTKPLGRGAQSPRWAAQPEKIIIGPFDIKSLQFLLHYFALGLYSSEI
jgi:hypothetical protein